MPDSMPRKDQCENIGLRFHLKAFGKASAKCTDLNQPAMHAEGLWLSRGMGQVLLLKYPQKHGRKGRGHQHHVGCSWDASGGLNAASCCFKSAYKAAWASSFASSWRRWVS